jgi:DNA-directed RNA polymerase subunit RPC12/RpoP
VFRGNGDYNYVCVSCGSLLAVGMDPQFMTRRVRVRCARCRTVNIAAELPVQAARRPRRGD